MGVEVAPRELAHERAAAALERARLELARRQAAEVQVGRQLRRPAGEPVVALLVAVEPAGEPARRALARRVLAGREGVGRLRPGRGREAADGESARKAQRPRGPMDLAALELLPRSVEGREDGVGLDGADVGDEHAGLRMRRDTDRLGDPPVAGERERRDVLGVVERGRAAFARERGQLLLRPALADHQVAAALAQRPAQLGEAAVQEPGAVGRGEAAGEQPRVEDEHGHHPVALAVRGGEGGVVVDAQIAPQPDEGGGAHTPGTGARRT